MAPSPKNPVFDHIRHELSNHDVVVYMKGTAAFPQCGFSAAVVQVFNHMGVTFRAIDVTTDPPLWEGLKQFSNWPTLPQVYVKGQFIGGCDITREMYQTGELLELLQKHNIPVRAEAQNS